MASTGSIPEEFDSTLGIIHTIPQGLYRTRLNRGNYWCLDNGVFTGKFEVTKWLSTIEKLKEYVDKCLFISIPDVIGDFSKTLERFFVYRDMVKDLPVALVSQDGIQELEHKIPWDSFDCIFIGGSNEHKLGDEGMWTLQQAKKHGKWVHVGRVNSAKRMNMFWEADSWDGTHLGFYPKDAKKFHNIVLQIRWKKEIQNEVHDS